MFTLSDIERQPPIKNVLKWLILIVNIGQMTYYQSVYWLIKQFDSNEKKLHNYSTIIHILLI